MKKNPEIIFFFILGALGILSKQFLSQTKYYPNFLKDFNNPLIEGLIIAVVFIILFGVPGFFIILLVEKIFYIKDQSEKIFQKKFLMVSLVLIIII